MFRYISVLWLLLFLTVSTTSFAQYGQLDPKSYDPEVDADIDMYMRSWKESMPRHSP